MDLRSTFRGALWRGIRSFAALAVAMAGVYVFLRVVGRVQPIGTWLTWPLLEVWGFALLFWGGATSFGALLLRRVVRHESATPLEGLALATPLGLVAFNAAMYVGGALHLFRPWFGVALPATMLLVGATDLRAIARAFRLDGRPDTRQPSAKFIGGLATVLGVVGATFVYLAVLTPDVINFDASWSHIPIAQDYARAGRLIPFDADYTRELPHLASIAHTYAYLVPLKQVSLRWMLCLHDEYGAVLFTLVGVGALAERLVGRRVRAGWATFFLFPGILVYDLGLGGAADHYQALFTAPLVIATLAAMGTTDARRFVLVGLFAGGAFATKVHAVHLVAPVALTLLVAGIVRCIRKGGGDGAGKRSFSSALVAPLAVFGASTFVALSPHLVRNTVFHGNPVYPFALNVFRKSHPAVPGGDFLFEYLFKDWAHRPHGTVFENLKESLGLSFAFSFAPQYSFTKSVPSFGSLFTLSLAFIPFIRERTRILVAAGVMMGAVFIWAMTFRVDRHLQPFVPLAAAVTCAILVRVWELGSAARLGAGALVAVQVAWGADTLSYSASKYIQSSLDLIKSTYDGHAETRFSSYRRTFLDIGAALPKNAVVVLHHHRPSLGIDRTIYLDWAGQQGLIDYRPMRTPKDVFDRFHALGVTHILFLPNEREAPSRQEDALFNTFVHRYAVHSRRFSQYELVEMPTSSPPLATPWNALSLSLPGYADGVYPIEAMGVFDGLPDVVRSYPTPTIAVDRHSDDFSETLEHVDVVFVGRGAQDVAASLGGRFESVASYGGSTVYVAK